MKWLLGVFLTFGLMSVALADEAKPSAHALDLARRVVLANGDEKSLIAASEKLAGSQSAAMQERQKKMLQDMGLPPAKAAAPDTTRVSAMIATMVPKMIEARVNIYASVYTEAELQGMLDYFASPIGQSVLAKAPLANEKAGQAMLVIINEQVAKMLEELTESLKKLAPPAKPASPPRNGAA